MDELNNTPNEAENVDYIKAIEELKRTSVPAEKYEQLLAERRQLITALSQGQTLQAEQQPQAIDVDALRKSLFATDSTIGNLEYAQKILQLREGILGRGEMDPFVPVGKNIAPTREDYEGAERVAEALAHCIEYADGDNSVFTTELQRIMTDVSPLKNKSRR